jgi:hypothetical protein
MVSFLGSRSRSIDLLASYVIILSVLSITAFGQTPHVVLGTRRVEASLDTDTTQMAEAFPVTATSSAQINSLSLFLDGSNSAATVWVGLYSNFYGHPNTLLRQAAIMRPVSGRWNSVNIPSVRVKLGRRYWVALLGLNGQIAFRDTTGDCSSETSQQTALMSLPPTWRTGSRWSTCVVSMFGSAPSGTSVSLMVSPTTASLLAAQQKQFAATISGTTNTAVTWKASGGTVTSGGLYTAPSSAGTYIVTAISAADSTKSSSAVVQVSQPTQLSISVSPSALSLSTGGQKQFSASVSGSSNTAVSWSASGGTITTGGLYVAPSTAGNYAIQAVSLADPTKSASATVSVSAPQTISVSVSPTAVAMPQQWQQQFAAKVSGSSNSAVVWSVTQGTGTITQSGLYTAPPAVETDVIAATSQADSTKSASANVTVVPPHSVSLGWSAPTSPNISYYKVYRGTVSGGPYSVLSNRVTVTSYTDSSVQAGSTYYYVTTAVETSGKESAYSGVAQAVIPML